MTSKENDLIATGEEQKAEAAVRMKMLKLHENAINEFVKESKLNLSESGILYWLDDKQADRVKQFESKYDTVVYHVIHSYTEFGELLSMLYVSKNKDEWENDRADLSDGFPLVYVANLDDEYCSELGSIGVKPLYGGVLRTA